MIGYYIHHHGSGHVQRALAIAAFLGADVAAFSSLARPDGWAGEWIQLPSDAEPLPDAAARQTAGGRLHWAPLAHAGYRDRMGIIARWIANVRPAAFVVDVSVEVGVLARSLGVPTIVMGMRGDRRDKAHRLGYDLAEAIVAPWPTDLPEPWWPSAWLEKTNHVGAISRFDSDVPAAGGGSALAVPTCETRRVLCLLGAGGADPHDLDGAQRATPGWEWMLAGGATFRPRAELWDLLRRADVVVTHGGQNAVADVAAARRPAVVVAQQRPHDEQLATVRALERGNLAVGLEGWPPPDAWPVLLESALDRGGGGWSAWHDGHGAERAAAAIRELVFG